MSKKRATAEPVPDPYPLALADLIQIAQPIPCDVHPGGGNERPSKSTREYVETLPDKGVVMITGMLLVAATVAFVGLRVDGAEVPSLLHDGAAIAKTMVLTNKTICFTSNTSCR